MVLFRILSTSFAVNVSWVVFGALATPMAFAADPVKCEKGFPQVAAEYPRLVCGADRLAREGRYQDAIKAYRRAAGLNFHEAPNFEIYVRIGRTECESGEVTKGRETLNSFQTMLDVYQGKVTCSSLEADSSARSGLARKTMCDEILKDSYAQPQSKELVADIGSLSRQLREARQTCARTK